MGKRSAPSEEDSHGTNGHINLFRSQTLTETHLHHHHHHHHDAGDGLVSSRLTVHFLSCELCTVTGGFLFNLKLHFDTVFLCVCVCGVQADRTRLFFTVLPSVRKKPGSVVLRRSGSREIWIFACILTLFHFYVVLVKLHRGKVHWKKKS